MKLQDGPFCPERNRRKGYFLNSLLTAKCIAKL